MGVVVLDDQGVVRLFNRYEERLAGRAAEDVLGRPFFSEVAPCMRVKELAGIFATKIGREALGVDLQFSFPFPFLPRPREVVVRLRSFVLEDEHFGLLYLEDVSARMTMQRMRERFSQLLVHDMKNPLSIITANLGLVEEEARGSVDLADALADSRAAADRLNHMLVELLDHARLQSDGLPLRRVETDVVGVARECARMMRAVARVDGVTIALDAPATCSATIDSEIIRRAIANLVENAIRYAPSGTTVTIGVAREDDALRLFVRDEGPGVPDELRAHIFDAYVRVDDDDRDGTNRGLGLSFVRIAATAHDGAVTVSNAPGGGAVFEIRLPLGESRT